MNINNSVGLDCLEVRIRYTPLQNAALRVITRLPPANWVEHL